MSAEFFDWQIKSKKSSFRTGPPSRKSRVKKALFRLCKIARFGLQSKKAVFD